MHGHCALRRAKPIDRSMQPPYYTKVTYVGDHAMITDCEKPSHSEAALSL
jgi:hypothetical protein